MNKEKVRVFIGSLIIPLAAFGLALIVAIVCVSIFGPETSAKILLVAVCVTLGYCIGRLKSKSE